MKVSYSGILVVITNFNYEAFRLDSPLYFAYLPLSNKLIFFFHLPSLLSTKPIHHITMRIGWTRARAFLALRMSFPSPYHNRPISIANQRLYPTVPLAAADDGDSSLEFTQTKILVAHGIVTSIAFVILFPLFAAGLHIIPWSKTVPRIHAPLQLFTLCVALAGLGLGAYAVLTTDEMDSFHVTIGLVIVGGLVLVQPLMGLIQHLHFRRTGGKCWFAYIHRWFGRVMIILGVINGGLGLMLAGEESAIVSKVAVIVYSVVAAVSFLFYAVTLFVASLKKKSDEVEGKEV